MIHEIGKEIAAQLVAKKCPLPVFDGPEPTQTTTGARERIIIEHDENGGDGFSFAASQHKNPRMRGVRNIGVTITIYAQAPNAGGTHWEHRRRAEHVLDLVTVALYDVLKIRRNGFTIKKAGFIQPPDLAKSETIAGAVYQMTLTIERGIFDQTWAYENRPQATIAEGQIKSHTEASIANGSGAPDTACGG